jgi:hypothetical protein
MRDRAHPSRFETMPDRRRAELRYLAEAADQSEAHGSEVLRQDTTDTAVDGVVLRILQSPDAQRA